MCISLSIFFPLAFVFLTLDFFQGSLAQLIPTVPLPRTILKSYCAFAPRFLRQRARLIASQPRANLLDPGNSREHYIKYRQDDENMVYGMLGYLWAQSRVVLWLG
jgi:hypothetical protein